jgi:hypothetical protein
MAEKGIYVNLNGQKVNIIKDFRLNPLTTANRTSLGATLNSAHTGLQCYDTDENINYFWTGSAWTGAVAPVAGMMQYNGPHASLTTAPAGASDGDVYYMNTSGTLTFAGVTFSPSAVVQIGDQIVRRSATEYDVIQGNAVQATETVPGVMEIATQGETNTGTSDVVAVTPLKLATYNAAQGYAKKFFQNAITLVANTPLTVTHNLALSNKDAFVISVKDSVGSEVIVDVDSVGVNSLTIESAIAATNVTVTVVG